MAICPTMKDGTYSLESRHDLFYLCGVGQPDARSRGEGLNRQHTNVHLAVRPRVGAVASIESVYGVTFTITDAESIAIESLSDDFMDLPREHARCKNFQFAHQMFAVNAVGKDAPHTVIHELRTGGNVA